MTFSASHFSAPRNFRTQYDVPEKPTGTPPRFSPNAAETGPEIDKQEPFMDLILSNGFKAMVLLVILPAVKQLRGTLLRGEPDEPNRIRCISALRTFETLLTKVYEKAGEPLPAFLVNQFK